MVVEGLGSVWTFVAGNWAFQLQDFGGVCFSGSTIERTQMPRGNLSSTQHTTPIAKAPKLAQRASQAFRGFMALGANFGSRPKLSFETL